MKPHIVQGAPALQRVADLVRNLNPEKRWRVEIAQHQARRSTSQNKLYWSLVGAIATETGHDSSEIHEFVKQKFLPKRVVVIDGQEIEVVGSTALLDKPAFTELVERLSAWAGSELGIQI